MNPRFKELRTHLGLSQCQFARKIGVTDCFITKIELGKCGVSPNTIDKICSAFNVRKEWLVDGEGAMFNEETPSVDRHSFGLRVKELRQRNNLTQLQLADKIGYHKNQIYKVESGKCIPSEDFLRKVASTFGVSYNWLLTGEESTVEEVELDESLLSWLRRNPDVVKELRLRARLPQPKERDEQ